MRGKKIAVLGLSAVALVSNWIPASVGTVATVITVAGGHIPHLRVLVGSLRYAHGSTNFSTHRSAC